MSWFSRREPAARGAATQTAESGPEVFRSLALPAILTTLSRGHKLNVLDLGPAIGGNVERLSEFGCKLFIEDLFASKAATPAGEGMLSADFFAQFLSPPEGTLFDIVLAWDLFNYLDHRELVHLADRLRRFCRPGSLIFALISIHKTIPAQPIRFRFHGDDADQLIYEKRTQVERPGPRFASGELNDILRGFRVDRSFLLRHGIQEYLYVRDGA